jgi:hypothetical protein
MGVFPRRQLQHGPTHREARGGPHGPWRQPVRYYGRAGYRNAVGGGRSTSSGTLRSRRHICNTAYADWLTVHVRPHQREVCRLSPRGDATPLRPTTGRPSLAPSSFTRRPVGWPCGSLSQGFTALGRRRAYPVPSVSPCGEGRASAPVVRQLRRRSSEPPVLTTYLVVPASPGAAPRRTRPWPFSEYQHLWLVLYDDVYQRFTYVDQPTPSWFPTPLMRRVAAGASRPQPPSVQEEATLF